jgi:hypothetical protein
MNPISRLVAWIDSLPRLVKALLVTSLETTGLTTWLVLYIKPEAYRDPVFQVVSTVVIFLLLFPEHYLALGHAHQ